MVTVTNAPSGFGSPSASVSYQTANGTIIGVGSLNLPANPTPYAVIPAASSQPGDFYHYFCSISSAQHQLIGTGMSTTSGGGAVTLAIPVPWSSAGPAPAKFPTFTYDYPGFSGMPTTAYTALINWPVGTTAMDQIFVTATAGFQQGTNTITIPDLTSISGFLAPAPTGTTVGWVAVVFGGVEGVTSFINVPANGSGSFVQVSGQFTQP